MNKNVDSVKTQFSLFDLQTSLFAFESQTYTRNKTCFECSVNSLALLFSVETNYA